MLRLRITYLDARELRRTLDEELAHGALLVKVTPPEDLAFRDVVALELVSPGGSLAVEVEVVSVIAGVGIAVAFPPARVADVRALAGATPEAEGGSTHEIVRATAAPSKPAPEQKATAAEKIRLALHGTRDD